MRLLIIFPDSKVHTDILRINSINYINLLTQKVIFIYTCVFQVILPTVYL